MTAWQRAMPFVLAGFLLGNLIGALTNGGRGNWITVALLALLLALIVWRRGHVKS
jgi:hypothetical protein